MGNQTLARVVKFNQSTLLTFTISSSAKFKPKGIFSKRYNKDDYNKMMRIMVTMSTMMMMMTMPIVSMIIRMMAMILRK